MESILTFVQNVLTYFKEFDAANIIEMVKGIDFAGIVNAIKDFIAGLM